MLKGEAINYGRALREQAISEKAILLLNVDNLIQFLDVAIYEMEKK